MPVVATGTSGSMNRAGKRPPGVYAARSSGSRCPGRFIVCGGARSF